MKVAEAKKIIEELKGRFDAPFNSADKSTIEKLYYEVLGKTFRPTSCQNCYHDALIEIYSYLNKHKKMAKKSSYKLKAGAIINCAAFMNGQVYTNDNLTDKVAAAYLKKYPMQEVLFQSIPTKKGKAEEEETPEEVETEVTDTEVATTEEAETPEEVETAE